MGNGWEAELCAHVFCTNPQTFPEMSVTTWTLLVSHELPGWQSQACPAGEAGLQLTSGGEGAGNSAMLFPGSSPVDL